MIYVAIIEKQLRACTLTRLQGKYSKIVIKVQCIIEKEKFDIKELIWSLCVADEENMTIFSSGKAFSEITDIKAYFFGLEPTVACVILIYCWLLLSLLIMSVKKL